MFQVLRGRAGAGALLSASKLTLPPRCLANAAAHRCLSKVADTPTRDTTASTAAAGQEQDAVGAGNASTETDVMADPRHILLYTGSKRNVRISSSVTVVNGLYWSFYVGVLESQLPTTTWEPWGYVGLGFTAIMAAASHTFAKHWVSQISYLPDLRLLSIGTHTFLGNERMPRLVRLGGTVVTRTRPNAIYLTFKVRGDFFNSLMDTDDGVFHNKEMLMRLLKASPHGKVAGSSAAANDSDGSTAVKTKPKWKKRKRRRSRGL